MEFCLKSPSWHATTSIHVERRADATIVNFTKGAKQNEGRIAFFFFAILQICKINDPLLRKLLLLEKIESCRENDKIHKKRKIKILILRYTR